MRGLGVAGIPLQSSLGPRNPSASLAHPPVRQCSAVGCKEQRFSWPEGKHGSRGYDKGTQRAEENLVGIQGQHPSAATSERNEAGRRTAGQAVGPRHQPLSLTSLPKSPLLSRNRLHFSNSHQLTPCTHSHLLHPHNPGASRAPPPEPGVCRSAFPREGSDRQGSSFEVRFRVLVSCPLCDWAALGPGQPGPIRE